MATASEERLKILQMLEDDKITADEAATLLRALEGGSRAGPGARRPGPGLLGPDGSARYLRIHVTDLTTGLTRVNVTLPMSLVGAGLRIAERFAPDFEGFDMQELRDLLASGVYGKVAEVMDHQDNERVEIYVE